MSLYPDEGLNTFPPPRTRSRRGGFFKEGFSQVVGNLHYVGLRVGLTG